jgi:hypothetical protein
MKLNAAHLEDFPDAGLFQFMTEVKALLLVAGPFFKNMIGAANITDLGLLLARLEKLLLWPGTKVITAKLRAADRALDHALSAFGAYLRNIIRYSTDSVLLDAAEQLLAMLKHYGKIANKAYDTQTADIAIILANLNGAFAAFVTALGMESLRAALQAAFDNFKAVMAEREAIDKSRPRGPDGKLDSFPKVRRLISMLYRKIANLVNSGAGVTLSQEFDAFIAELNPVIDRFNREYQPVIYDISKSQPAPIPDEPWTGEERTPVPSSVLFKKGGRQLRLRLGRHYDVSYKSNIDVGNAYCILHGKGRYKGSKSVSFTIRHGGTNAEWDAEIEEAAAAKAEEAKKKKAKKTKKAAPVAPKAVEKAVKAEEPKATEPKAEPFVKKSKAKDAEKGEQKA